MIYTVSPIYIYHSYWSVINQHMPILLTISFFAESHSRVNGMGRERPAAIDIPPLPPRTPCHGNIWGMGQHWLQQLDGTKHRLQSLVFPQVW